MPRSRLTLIEFTADTDKRAKGSRLKVDPMSAVGFCDKQKVAVRVGQDQPTAPAPVIPVPPPVDVEPEDTTPADVDDV